MVKLVLFLLKLTLIPGAIFMDCLNLKKPTLKPSLQTTSHFFHYQLYYLIFNVKIQLIHYKYL